jgi:4-amino-4-deoxy-L-arabinose transferase-like glycosyltransferase
MPLLMNTTVSPQHRKPLILLAWCLLLALTWGLWLYQLDASDLTFDESATYYVAYRPPLEILRYLRGAVREHPPVYYLLIRGWMALAGVSEFSLRFFSVGVSLVALALTGWLARLAVPRTAPRPLMALTAAAMLAVTPGMAYYARDARMYSLGVVWTALSAGLFLRDWLATGGWPRRTAVVSLAAVHFLALFTHYYLLFPILVQPLALLIARRWRPLLTWCGVHCLPATVGLGWLWLSPGLQMSAGGLLHTVAIALPTRFELFHLVGKLLFSPVVQIRYQLLYWLLGLAGAGVLIAVWRRRAVGIWLTLALAAPPLLAYALPQAPAPRYLVFLLPFAALALASCCTFSCDIEKYIHSRPRPQGNAPETGAASETRFSRYLVKRRWLAGGATAGLTLIALWMLATGGLHTAITFDRSHYGRTLQTVRAYARPGDGVLFYGPWQWIPFRYYDPGDLPPVTTVPLRAPPLLEPAEAEPVLEELLSRYERLWVVPAAVDDVDPAHFVSQWLQGHAHGVWKSADLSLYLPPLPPGAPALDLGLTFGEELRLEQVVHEPQPTPAGEPLRLTLYWRSLRRAESGARLTLTLADRAGHVWDTVHSSIRATQTAADYEGLMTPQGAPPGEYVVRLQVTDQAAGQPLPVNGAIETDLLKVQIAEPAHAPVLYDLPHPAAIAFCAPDEMACLTLAGQEPGGLRFQQGNPIPLTLHWLSPSRPLPELQLRLQVTPRSWLPRPFIQHDPLLTRTLSLAPAYPTSQWTPGRLVTLPTRLQLPPDAPAGPAQVTLEVLGANGAPWLTADGAASVPLFPIVVEGRPVLRRLPAALTPVQVDFGSEIGLRGYRVEGSLSPGGQLRLTYAWYARTHPTAIYAVFNHLTTADGVMVAQVDSWPQGGRMLSTQWQAGEYIADEYVLDIPLDAPPGPYTLYVGVYNAANDERQPAFQDGQRLPDDRLPLPVSEIVPGEGGR